jgi:Pyridoxamine 5'-phosphate oxidase
MTHEVSTADHGGVATIRGASPAPDRATASRASTERVWAVLGKASFAIVSYVTPAGEPRSSGIVYAAEGRHLYMAVAPDGWKARQIRDGQQVAVTVPVRRGGVLSLLLPIPPATISFHARAIVHPAGSLDLGLVSKKLLSLLPEGRSAATVLELVPEGTFLAYGIGVSLMEMRDPVVALTHVPIG